MLSKSKADFFQDDMPNLLSQLPNPLGIYNDFNTMLVRNFLSIKVPVLLMIDALTPPGPLRAFGPFYKPDIENTIRQN